MSDPLKKCKANETAACCCVDVGTIIDNDESEASIEQVFATEQEAKAFLVTLTEKAKEIESDPCQIDSLIEKTANGYVVTAKFTFSCGAESLIFQLGLR
ncbi:YfcZ/YiiS family protein [Utexia brackfieldae]|uniref:YfcZ/YiiS family protein n=1 Tax=Utexia brackfieldae TaxID=3074108 RepID=UPI00370D9686